MADVARAERGVTTLHEATAGDPSRSRWYREAMEPFGAEQELRAGLRTRDGMPWATVEPAHPARISPLLMVAYGLSEGRMLRGGPLAGASTEGPAGSP
jgi:hypothetical protein